ncbi:cytochrome o ubiquinol oxidase subunit IV [Vreelandella profundi]|uniref:cytochrome o ubiquinol oxidase subunit IV n=1 Tax=Vreelandella profundi TaxID=2852117 RepID=UPI001EF07FA6|nr:MULTISPECIES: cytochrome o ubiquinol oxidase subunit IV [Halomonas]MDN7131646.1 cytochrome o ubiquinol oxidase subunit IV [Halomonas sp. MC140]
MSSSSQPSDHGTVKSYVTGLVLSLVLTIIPFGAIMFGSFSMPINVGIIAVTAILQVLVQLVMFMHLNFKSDDGWSMLSFVFTISILVLVIGGSLWIMQHLHLNMMIG